MQKIRLGILGYGNLGRGVQYAASQNPDMEVVAVFTRRDPSAVQTVLPVTVEKTENLKNYVDKIDVMILCGGSATDLPEQSAQTVRMFHTVDSFDTHAKIPAYFDALDAAAKETGHIGNAKVWEKVICNMKLFDKKLSTRYFQEIDIKYVSAYNSFMEKKGWCGNTRKHDMKTLRAILNRAIVAKECSSTSYPFGKGGFCISALEEETRKRYLPQEYLLRLMNRQFENKPKEIARRLFLFSYFCYGMSFIDMANLRKGNIRVEGTSVHIIYKRHKTEHSKNAKFIRIPMTDELNNLLLWFKSNSVLVGDYLLPLVSKDYDGEKLYDHLRRRLARYNERLKEIGEELGFTEKLTSYVSRHSMAMTLQTNGVPREMISQVMGHKDLETTNTYLDSFGDVEIEKMTINSLYKINVNL